MLLTRHRTLLAFLSLAGKPVDRFNLVKWAFLLRHESPSKGGGAFYDFLSYKFGPYSFGMAYDLNKMVEEGLVVESGKSWELTPAGKREAVLTGELRGDVKRVVERLGHSSFDQTRKYVYQRFPAFTVRSEIEKLAKPVTAPVAVYTAGYEGLSVDAFFDRLDRHGIKRLIDVRRNPVARRYGFHKSTFIRLCEHLDIAYEHVPELGIASEARQELTGAADYAALFAAYEKTTLVQEKDAIARVAALVQERPSVLVCMEEDPKMCHRTRLAQSVARLTKLPVKDLGGCACHA